MQDKFDLLLNTNVPKIVIVGGSNCAFGIDQNMLEDATGYKVVNLGLHAGFGHRFYTELSKANINEGDIILLAYEYTWSGSTAFTELDMDLIMSAIDDDIMMYRYLPSDIVLGAFGNTIHYASKKAGSEYDREGVYSRKGFDSETMQMIADRDDPFHFDGEINGYLSVQDVTISSETTDYLMDYKNYVEQKGAKVYFVEVPVARDSISCDYQEFVRLKEEEETNVGIEYISDPTDYFFEDECFFDTKYHCNKMGEERRTQQLIEDLSNAGVIK